MFNRILLPRLRLSLTAWMLLASALATLPLLAFALLTTQRLIDEHRQAQEQALVERARASAAAVRRVLERPAELTVRAVAGLLPGAPGQPGLTGGCQQWAAAPLTPLFVQAGPLQAEAPPLRAPGAGPLPPAPGPAWPRLPQLQSQAYPIERGGGLARWVVPVMLEARPDGAQAGTPRSWCVDVPVSEFAAVFAEQAWPADWTATVMDQRGRVVARNRLPELYVGQAGPESLRRALQAGLPRHLIDVVSLEGTPLRSAVVPVDDNGWVVAVGVPVAVLEEALWASWRPLLLVGAACLLLGLSAAAWLARQLGLHVRRTAAWTASTGWPDLDAAGADPAAAPRQDSPPGPRDPGRVARASRAWPESEPQPGRGPGPDRRGAARAPRAPAGPGGAGGVVVELGQIVGELRRARQVAQQASRALHGAHHDALTGLPQRALFMQELRRRLAAAHHDADGAGAAAGVAVLFIDLDGFKQVNDELGHDAGDRALRGVADVLRQSVRAGDAAGRLGGDEFVVAVAAAADEVVEIAQAVAQRIVQGVRGLGFGMGCSIGLMCSDGQLSAEDLLGNADQAMYSAKRAGKNRVVVHRRCSQCTLPAERACTHAAAPADAAGTVPTPCEWRRSAAQPPKK